MGANLASPRFGPPRATLGAALEALEGQGVRVVRRSPWYRSAPVPPSDQPSYVNGVAEVATGLGPAELLGVLLATEARLGRRRGARNAARIVDLDLVAYDDRVMAGDDGPVLPHPRMHERAFVLLPLRDLVPDWRHPASGRTLDELIAALPADQTAEPLENGAGLFGTEWKAKPRDRDG